MTVLLIILGATLSRWVMVTAARPAAERPAALGDRRVVVAGIGTGLVMIIGGAVMLLRLVRDHLKGS